MARGGGGGGRTVTRRHRKLHVGIVQLEDRLMLLLVLVDGAGHFGALGDALLERLKFVGNLVVTTAGRSRSRGSSWLGPGCRRRQGWQYVDLERNRRRSFRCCGGCGDYDVGTPGWCRMQSGQFRRRWFPTGAAAVAATTAAAASGLVQRNFLVESNVIHGSFQMVTLLLLRWRLNRCLDGERSGVIDGTTAAAAGRRVRFGPLQAAGSGRRLRR